MNTSFGVIGDALVATMQVRPVIIDEIQSLQDQDRFRFLRKMKENVRSGKGKDFMIRGDRMLAISALPSCPVPIRFLELPKQRH